MSPREQWLGCLALLLVVALVTAFRPAVPVHPPKLVVLVVIDQLRADYLERFRDQYQGGFRWLLENGAHFPDAAYRHASTVTGAGHATVSTGLHPSTHGVVGNSWREAGRGAVYCVEDARYVTVGGPGDGASPLALLGETLGDMLKARHGGSRVYSFSTKNRSAILLAGREADGAFWYEPACGCFVSSSYYGDSLPSWLAEFNAARPTDAYAGKDWNKLLVEDALYERMAREDRFPGEGEDMVFPHGRPERGFEDTLAATPFSDAITLGAALAALRSGEIGANGDPDLLALGLSATDAIGHRFGPFSQEAMDNHLRLDRGLGRFIEAVDAAVGLDNALFALTADHGAVPLVEHLQTKGFGAERFDAAALWERAERAVDDCGAGPATETVEQMRGTELYWDDRALRDRGVTRAQASVCLSEWLGRQRGVESAFSEERLAAGGGLGTAKLFENAFFASRSPHVKLHLRKYFYAGGATGTGHGSAHAYDRQVPVLLAGVGIVPGRYPGGAGPEDLAPTLATILGLETRLEPDTRVLREALVREPD
jgi:predicted AlkP superfamily pyrophosphatase or phosphodiesterase